MHKTPSLIPSRRKEGRKNGRERGKEGEKEREREEGREGEKVSQSAGTLCSFYVNTVSFYIRDLTVMLKTNLKKRET